MSVSSLLEVKEVTCNKNCNTCKQLNRKTDDKGYPYGYECMKYGDSVFESEFSTSKSFVVNPF